MIKQWLKQEISHKFPDVEFEILPTPDEKLGDYSTNLAFVLAKREKISPMAAGKNLIGEFSADPIFSEKFQKIQLVPPGFINFYLNDEYLQQQLSEIYGNRDDYGTSSVGSGKTIIIDYSAPNIAKPMHVGHLRSTIIGDGLANVYESLGYKVIRWNYLGDWGTQFGKLVAAYKLWGNEGELKKEPIKTMLDLYVRFHDELKTDPKLEKSGQGEFKKLEDGDSENRKLWEMFKQYSLKEFESAYQQLGIVFDITKGESDYETVLGSTLAGIEKVGILKKSEGAEIIELEGLPPALIKKSDGATLYITRDIALLQDRLTTYHPSKILYVVANQQALHFEQLFAISKLLGLIESELVHVKFGMVLGEDGKKFATREGKAVALQEVIDKIIVLARKVVAEKNTELSEQEMDTVAQAVGIGALKYNDLKQHPYSDITFDWEQMLNFTGNSGPYLQYTYSRLASILRKSSESNFQFSISNFQLLTDPKELKIMKKLLGFPEAIEKCAEHYTLNGLALYLYELANDANHFYETIRILTDDHKERLVARLVLIETVAAVLKKGLKILGIETLDRI